MGMFAVTQQNSTLIRQGLHPRAAMVGLRLQAGLVVQANTLVFVGRADDLVAHAEAICSKVGLDCVSAALVRAAVGGAACGISGGFTSVTAPSVSGGSYARINCILLPTEVSRHNCALRPDVIAAHFGSAVCEEELGGPLAGSSAEPPAKQARSDAVPSSRQVVLVRPALASEEAAEAALVAMLCAAARACPLYSRKSSSSSGSSPVHVACFDAVQGAFVRGWCGRAASYPLHVSFFCSLGSRLGALVAAQRSGSRRAYGCGSTRCRCARGSAVQ